MLSYFVTCFQQRPAKMVVIKMSDTVEEMFVLPTSGRRPRISNKVRAARRERGKKVFPTLINANEKPTFCEIKPSKLTNRQIDGMDGSCSHQLRD
jgi:hypothetical protein